MQGSNILLGTVGAAGALYFAQQAGYLDPFLGPTTPIKQALVRVSGLSVMENALPHLQASSDGVDDGRSLALS